MPATIVGGLRRVVDAPGLSIDELAGNVSTNSDRISIARVQAKAGTAEPWLTLHYDEWICVIEGSVVIEQVDQPVIEVTAGQTVLIESGTRFKPSFPSDVEYIPVCLPAFRPDRCIREDSDAEGEAIAQNLKTLHGVVDESGKNKEPPPEVLYHMTTKAEWDKCKESGEAYYPKTFEEDGFYTHATGVPSRLLTTANHFYQDVEGDWVCLVFSRSALRKCGIFVRDEEAMPVGEKAVGDDWDDWVCPHIVGGIPPSVVEAEHLMRREGAEFIAIDSVC